MYLAALGISALVAYAVGFRNDALFGVVALALWPVYFVLTMLNMRLIPPEVELSGDFRGILYTCDPEDPSRPPEPMVFGAPRNIPLNAQATGDGSARTFELPAQPRTLEGVVIYVGAFVLVAFAVYLALQPVIYRFLPEFGATKQGPPGFPVTVHIGADSLRIGNGSSERGAATWPWADGSYMAPRLPWALRARAICVTRSFKRKAPQRRLVRVSDVQRRGRRSR